MADTMGPPLPLPSPSVSCAEAATVTALASAASCDGAVVASSSTSAAAAAVAPDETVYDVLQTVRSSRGTGLTFLDAQLPGGRLGPSELLVLHGEAMPAKSALLRGVIATYVAPLRAGGHELPIVIVDTEGSFDVRALARMLEERALAVVDCATAEDGSGCDDRTFAEDLVEEALSRLLVLHPREPIDLLKHLYGLREVLAANPTVGLLVVDSMSSWQALGGAFPRSVLPPLRAAWRAIRSLQREHCLAAVTTWCDAIPQPAVAAMASAARGGCPTSDCLHLIVSCATATGVTLPVAVADGRTDSASAGAAPRRLFFTVGPCIDASRSAVFIVSEATGEAMGVAH
eukprot:TRINITY_DN25094_c0_g2_i1.p1 TRINITY_DN25094_c0_g2~~TRINITY_DN25094_c0_g2_i1.p1  ORF type:complete len:345 (+),score=58.38 TRINITY_DN25094_c0_g2_i1:74-1108(+)